MPNANYVPHIKSTRDIDSRAEGVLGAFLDKYFYGHLKQEYGNEFQMQRITDKELQCSGVDMYLRRNFITRPDLVPELIPVDEKYSITHRNENLGAYPFEISSLDRHKKEHIGWFVNDNLATTAYLIMWPTVRTEKNTQGREVPIAVKDIKSPSDVVSVDGIFVRKQNLRNAIDEMGVSRDFLVEQAKLMRKAEIPRVNINKDMHLTCSLGLYEQPIVLVVSRDLLRKVCDWTPFTVTKDKVICSDLFNDKHKKQYNRHADISTNTQRRANHRDRQNYAVRSNNQHRQNMEVAI